MVFDGIAGYREWIIAGVTLLAAVLGLFAAWVGRKTTVEHVHREKPRVQSCPGEVNLEVVSSPVSDIRQIEAETEAARPTGMPLEVLNRIYRLGAQAHEQVDGLGRAAPQVARSELEQFLKLLAEQEHARDQREPAQENLSPPSY